MRQVYVIEDMYGKGLAAFAHRDAAEVASDAMGTYCSIEALPVIDTDDTGLASLVLDRFERGEEGGDAE